MPSYRLLVRQPIWRRFLIASTAARLPITMGVFGMVLAGRALGSFSLGGRLAAVYTLSGAAAAVWRGRRLDRGDLRAGLRREGAAAGVVAVALAVAVRAHAGWPVAAVLAVLAGVALAGIPGGYRALIPEVVPADEVGGAYALDAVCVEACFVTGPAVAGAVGWFAGATGVFVLMAVFGFAGAAASGRLPSVVRTPLVDGAATAPHRIPTMIGVLIGTLAAGASLGVLDATFPALAVSLGTRAAVGGGFITVMAFGSGIAGLTLGRRLAASTALARRGAQVLLCFGLVVIPMAFARDLPPVAALAMAAGAPFALMSTAASILIQRTVDPTRISEAFSFLNAALLAGAAAGSAVASVLLAPLGPSHTLLVAALPPVLAGGALLGAISAAGRRPRRAEINPASATA